MATFTVELRRVVELTGGDIGLDDYPIFEPGYREILNKKIIDHYYYNEIGHETIDQFRHQLGVKMREIMPYYNKLYESERLEFDPLSTVNVKTETDSAGTAITEANNTSNATNSATSDAKARAVESVLPQVTLSPNADYATSANDSTSETLAESSATDTTTALSEGTNTGHSSSTTSGYTGAASELLLRYRETIINIDLMVIGELRELFMQLWNNGDEYSRPSNWYFERF